MCATRAAPRPTSIPNPERTALYPFTPFVAARATDLALGDDVAGFLPDSMADGPAKSAVGLLLIFHTAVAYLAVGQPLHRAMHACIFPSTVDAFTQRAAVHWFIVTSAQLVLHQSIPPLNLPPARDPRLSLACDVLRFLSRPQALSVLLATAIPFFSELQSLLGSLTGAPIVFGWPAFFFLRSCAVRGVPVGWADFVVCGAFLGLLLPMFLTLGTASAVQEIMESWRLNPGVSGATVSG